MGDIDESKKCSHCDRTERIQLFCPHDGCGSCFHDLQEIVGHFSRESSHIPSTSILNFEKQYLTIVGAALIALHPIALHERIEHVLFFEKGIYRFQGETRVKSFCQQVITNCNTNEVNSILDTIRRLTYVERAILGVENNPHLVLENCLYNIESKEQEPFSVCLEKNYYFLNKLPVNYDGSAVCPKFISFINEILLPQDVLLVQEILGAILRKWYFTKKLAVFTGPPNSGKTTLLSVFTALLGEDNISAISMQRLGKGDKFTLGPMFGKMANIADDLAKDAVKSIGLLKQLTGLSIMQAERKFGQEFTFVNYAFLLFACNDLPPITEDDEAFWDRMIQVDFTHPISKERINRNLLAELTTKEELSGILNWGLEGLARLQSNGWNFSRNETKEQAREKYRSRSEPLEYCIKENYEETGEDSDYETKDEFFNVFKGYCSNLGIEIWTKDKIGRYLPAVADVVSDHVKINGKDFRVWRHIKRKQKQDFSTGRVIRVDPQPVHPVVEREGPHEGKAGVQVGVELTLLAQVEKEKQKQDFTSLLPGQLGYGADCEYCGSHRLAIYLSNDNRLVCKECVAQSNSNEQLPL